MGKMPPQRNSGQLVLSMNLIQTATRHGDNITLFLFLQALDVITTLIGLRMGASEGSIFVARLMYVGPVTGLLIAKGFGLLLMVAAIALANRRIFVWLNFWFTGIVTWNLIVILGKGLIPRLIR
jgi:hypothetical protein